MTDPISQSAVTAWVRLVRAQQGAIVGVEALKRAGFPPLIWYDVLLELERAPDSGLRQRDIQRRTLLKRYNVSRIVDRIEAEGLASREPCADDARGTIIQITAKGRALRQAMWPVYAAAINNNFAQHYSEDELERLAELLAPLSI